MGRLAGRLARRWAAGTLCGILVLFLCPVPGGANSAPASPTLAETIEVSSTLGGTVDALAVDGSYAYLGYGAQILILDITNIETPGPKLVGMTGLVPGLPRFMVIYGDTLYAALGESGLAVYDVTDRSNPVEAAQIEFEDGLKYLTLDGGYAYLLTGNKYLHILDISSPKDPILLSTTYTNGTAFTVAVMGHYALTEGQGGLQVWDVQDKRKPALAVHLSIEGYPSAIAVESNYAFVMDSLNGVSVVDFTDPEAPVLVAAYSSSWVAQSMIRSGSTLLVSRLADGVETIDISDPLTPQLSSRFDPGGYSNQTAVNGGYVLISCDLLGLCVYNFNDPANPVFQGLFPLRPSGMALDVAIEAGVAFVAKDSAGLSIVDLSQPDRPVEISSFPAYIPDYQPADQDQAFLGYACGVKVDLPYAYLLELGGLRVIDLQDLNDPVERAFLPVTETTCSLAYEAGYAYLIDATTGELKVIDVRHSGSPAVVGAVTLVSPLSVVVKNGYAFVSAGDGLHIFSLADKTSPQPAGLLELSEGIRSMDVAMERAYLMVAGSLRIVDVSNKSQPQLLSRTDFADFMMEVTAVGYRAFINDNHSMVVLDVTNPQIPVILAEAFLPARSGRVAVADQTAYLANRCAGLVTLPLPFLPDPYWLYIPFISKHSQYLIYLPGMFR